MAIDVPAYVAANATRGLKYLEQGHGGEGLVEQTIRDARQMAAGTVSEAKVRRIGPWIARHIVDLDAPANRNPDAPGYPGPGLVAMLLWGAGPDRAGAIRTQQWAEREAAALDTSKAHGKADESIVVTDVDGTIADGNTPIDEVIQHLRRRANQGHPVHIVSGRPIDRLEETRAWLEQHQVPHAAIHLSDFPTGPNSARAFKTYKAKLLLEEYSILEWIDNDATTREALTGLGINAIAPRTAAAGDSRATLTPEQVNLLVRPRN